MRFFTSVYALLLAYIIVFIVFWEMSLQRQSRTIYSQQVMTLRASVDSSSSPQIYNERINELAHNRSLRTMQFIGEGGSFIIITLIGAFIVYTSFRRSMNLSKQQNNFMLSVTHELKSPIAAIKLNLQTIEKHKLDENRKVGLVNRCINEANRLNDLCNNILFASQIEGRQYKAAKEKFNFSEMAEDSLSEYAMRYPQRFEEDIAAGCYIVGDKMMLQIVINNLLENAVKYTPADKPISVLLYKNEEENTAVLQVVDQGAGIPDNEKKRVFNKFYRVGNEESRKAKGTGLGLYLAKKVVMQHKGTINIKDNTPSGAVFEILLPLSAAS